MVASIMSWRLAKSLIVLREQINEAYPTRDKTSDGSIGDDSHDDRASDHNPNRERVVCAIDIDHDPDNGLDAHLLADHLRVNRHPNLKYIISDKRIASSRDNWVWRKYTGSNPHKQHIHISVGRGKTGSSEPPYDDETLWNISTGKKDFTLITGAKIMKQIGYKTSINLDNNGSGYVDIFHSEGKDPVVAVAIPNGNNPKKEGYPKIGKPTLLASFYDGNVIKITCVGGSPNSSFGLQVLASWS